MSFLLELLLSLIHVKSSCITLDCSGTADRQAENLRS